MKAALVLALCLALGACMDGEPDVTPQRNPHSGTNWVMQGEGRDRPTIEFTDSRASGSTSCNRWFAQTVGSETRLSFSAIGSTRRVCEPALMETERTFIAALRDTRVGRIENDVLVLRDSSGAELARFDRVE